MPLALHIPVFSMNLGFHHLPTDLKLLILIEKLALQCLYVTEHS